jgi:choline-sulfatase
MAATIEHAVHGEGYKAEKSWQSRALQEFIENPDPERPILSEYHDGGSPCGFFMLRKGRWKYVYFSEGHPALLFDIENDPRELVNLSDEPEHVTTLTDCRNQLLQILDPEEVNRQAFADQAKMIETLGGMDVILAMPSFNHTPID